MDELTKLQLEVAKSAWFESYKACCDRDERDFDREACEDAWADSEVKASIYERAPKT